MVGSDKKLCWHTDIGDKDLIMVTILRYNFVVLEK